MAMSSAAIYTQRWRAEIGGGVAPNREGGNLPGITPYYIPTKKELFGIGEMFHISPIPHFKL